MNRRDLLLGAGCVAALAGAEALRPRRLVSLLGRDRTLSSLIPVRFAGWEAEGGGDIVRPKVPGTLSAMLYSETVSRTYRHRDGGAPVLFLAAHGDSQSDLLQLHRPETCYQAIGFQIVERRFDPVALPHGVSIPTVEMTARAGSRTEDVLYWTRLGEYLPRTAGEQRRDRLRTAMAGDIADGVLVRSSLVRDSAQPDWARLNRFTAAMIAATGAAGRRALLGTARTAALDDPAGSRRG